jgi:hypothetical protein
MKNTTLLCCAVILLLCNACEKEKEIVVEPILPVFEDNFDRASLGDRWTAYYNSTEGVYIENNMVVMSSPLGGTSPRMELKEGEYNKPEFKLSMQFKLDNVAIASNTSVRLFTNPPFMNFWFELRKDSWSMGINGSTIAGSISAELKADEWYLLQMSATDKNNEKQLNVVEMKTGLTIMSDKLQSPQAVVGPWNITSNCFGSLNGTRKLYIDNFKIY